MQIPIILTWKQAAVIAVVTFVLAWIVKFFTGVAFNLLLLISGVAIVYGLYLRVNDYIGHLYDDHISGSED